MLHIERPAQIKWLKPHTCFAASGVDLGFYKAGCPIHRKEASDVEGQMHQRGSGLGRGLCPSPENFCISYIKMV